MECEEIRERLVDYADGDLSIRDAVAIRTHLSHCYTCQEEFNEIRAVFDVCKTALKHPNPVNRFDQLRQRMAAEPKPAVVPISNPRVRRLGYALATAASLAMILWTSGPTVRAARAFIAPLRPDPAAFQQWVQSEESVAPIVAQSFINRRMGIEKELEKEGALSEPARLAQQPAGVAGSGPEPTAQPAIEPGDGQDARLKPASSNQALTHA